MKKVTNRLTMAAGAIIILMAAVLLSCGEGSKDLGPEVEAGTLDWSEVVNGTTYADYDPPVPLPGCRVELWCEDCNELLIGDYADHAAHYSLGTENELSGHNGHTLKVIGSHPKFYEGTAYIYNFQWGNIPYTRDVYLTPE